VSWGLEGEKAIFSTLMMRFEKEEGRASLDVDLGLLKE